MVKAVDVLQMVECLSKTQQVLDFTPQHCIKLDVVVYAFSPSIWEVQSGGSRIQGEFLATW